MLKTLKC